MLNLMITGACGRMGRTLVRLVQEDPDLKLVSAVEDENCPEVGRDAGLVAGVGEAGVTIKAGIANLTVKPEVLIDFTSPVALPGFAEYARQNGIAMVVGTTGLTDEHLELLRRTAESVPVIWSPNFSVGVNLMLKLCKLASEVLKEDFDVEIIEAHHRMKKDSPSGTAKKLLEVIREVYCTEDVIYGREGMIGERPLKQIGVHAVRGGGIVGEHTVMFAGSGERFELIHKASSRDTFARGAIRAAKFVAHRSPGFYTMEQVLGL